MKTFCFGEPIEIWTESYNKKIEDYANYIVDPVNNKKPNENVDIEKKIKYFGYNSRKVYADIYLDDKAMKR